MCRKHYTFILAIILLTSCSPGSTAATPTESSVDSIATSVALTLEAWAPEKPETDTSTPEPENADAPTTVSMGNLTMLAADYENALPVETQLMIGTLEIEQIGQNISPAQAAVLLPLWQDLRNLVEIGSDQTMITSQITQIVQAMTLDQVTTIADMQASQDDLMRISEMFGIEMVPGGENFPGRGAGDSQGTPPEGTRKGVADPPAGETVMTGRGGATGNISRINAELLDAVIEFLEKELVSSQ